jgi:hypothetical protein
MSPQSHIGGDASGTMERVNFLRTAGLVLIALLVPGGLVVLVPTLYRLFIDLRDRHRARGRAGLASPK